MFHVQIAIFYFKQWFIVPKTCALNRKCKFFYECQFSIQWPQHESCSHRDTTWKHGTLGLSLEVLLANTMGRIQFLAESTTLHIFHVLDVRACTNAKTKVEQGCKQPLALLDQEKSKRMRTNTAMQQPLIPTYHKNNAEYNKDITKIVRSDHGPQI